MAFWGPRQPATLPRAFGPSDLELAEKVRNAGVALNTALRAAHESGLQVQVDFVGASSRTTPAPHVEVEITRKL